jgi:hypothetical protein
MGESAREKRVQDKCRESDRAGEYSGRLQSTRMPPAHEKISGVCAAPAASRAEFKHNIMYMHALRAHLQRQTCNYSRADRLFYVHALLSQSWGNPRRSAHELVIEANQDAILCLFVYIQLQLCDWK